MAIAARSAAGVVVVAAAGVAGVAVKVTAAAAVMPKPWPTLSTSFVSPWLREKAQVQSRLTATMDSTFSSTTASSSLHSVERIAQSERNVSAMSFTTSSMARDKWPDEERKRRFVRPEEERRC